MRERAVVVHQPSPAQKPNLTLLPKGNVAPAKLIGRYLPCTVLLDELEPGHEICLHCGQAVDLTGVKPPIVILRKGLLCDEACEKAYLKKNRKLSVLVKQIKEDHPVSFE